MDSPLDDTKITGNQLKKWLSDFFQRQVPLKSCKAIKIAAGEGFTSTILRVHLEYDEKDDSLPKSVIVKTPSIPAVEDLMQKMGLGPPTGQQAGPPAEIPAGAPGGQGPPAGIPTGQPDGQGPPGNNSAGQPPGPPAMNIDEMVEFMTFGHSTECEVYKMFGRNPPIPLPIIYAATKCHIGEMGAIVMEDLGPRASIIGDPTSSLSLEQLYEAADAVASWHAWCLTTDVDWRKHVEPADSERRMQTFGGWFEMMRGIFERVKANYPNVFDKMDELIKKKPFSVEEFTKFLRKNRAICSDTIVHGDFYANNLMYEASRDESGKVTVGSKLIAIIDWPMATSGNCMEDFGRLLSMSVDTETRRRHTNHVLRRYYDTLVKKADSKVTVSFDQVVSMYEDNLVMAGSFFVLMLDWLQNLFVRDTGDEGLRKRKILFDRCLGVYEDILPLMEKQEQEEAAAAAAAATKT